MPLPSLAKNAWSFSAPRHFEVQVDVLLEIAQADRGLVLAADAHVVEEEPPVR